MKHILLVLFLSISFTLTAQVKDLGKLFAKGKYEKIIGKGTVFLENDSDNPEINSLVGRAYMALGKYEKAIPFLQLGLIPLSEKPFVQAWSLAELGKAYYHTGQSEKGIASLKKAIEMAATRNCTRFANNCLMRFQESTYFQNWEIHETKNLRFHFQDISTVDNIDEYITLHEKAYNNINAFFKVKLSKKIDFFVWKDREEAFRVLGRPLGFANSKRKIINAWYKQTKGHEICHILCDEALHPKKKSMLINEGIAVYFDQTTRNKMDQARSVLPKDEFHLLELWESPTHYERDLSYPMGGAFIDFLINKEGTAKLKELLKNQTIENAKVIYPDFMDLVKTFEAMLER